MNISNTRFVTSVSSPGKYPDTQQPEIAFAGRSNVGKSSLINLLANRKSLAKVGATPGKTRLINFFNVDDSLYLVDLPGYGFANVPKGEKDAWGRLINDYLNNREQLKLVILVVDIRHDPTQQDMQMMEWLKHSGLHFMVAASKADKLNRSQQAMRRRELARSFGIDDTIPVVAFSALKNEGRDELWQAINGLLEQNMPDDAL